MEVFSGCEVSFGSGYFRPTTNRLVIRVSRDAPVERLADCNPCDIPKQAGTVSFPSGEYGLEDRFIIWHTNERQLHLDEYSTVSDLANASLTLEFAESAPINETNFFVRNNMFIVAAATQAGIHTFQFPIYNDHNLGSCINDHRSLFDFVEPSLSLYHDYHRLNPRLVAVRALFAIGTDGRLHAFVCTKELQFVRVTLLEFRGNHAGTWSEMVYDEDKTVFTKLFKKPTVRVTDAAVVRDVDEDGELLVYNILADGTLRGFRGLETTPFLSRNIAEFIDDGVETHVHRIEMVAAKWAVGRGELLIFKLSLPKSTRFIVLRPTSADLQLVCRTDLNSTFVSRFTATVHESDDERLCVWLLDRPTVYEKDKFGGEYYQPYLLKRCVYYIKKKWWSGWETIRSSCMDSVLDKSVQYSPIDVIRNRIFDGDSFAFTIVLRVVRLMLDDLSFDLPYNNWVGLREMAESVVHSAKFINANSSDDPEVYKSAVKRYWEKFLHHCYTLDPDDQDPIGFLHSPHLKLFGVIQKTRLSVFLPADDQMHERCEPKNDELRRLFLEVEEWLGSDEAIEKISTRENSNIMLLHLADFEAQLAAFIEHRRENFHGRLRRVNSKFLSSSFTNDFMGAALRRRVMGRLRYADVLLYLLKSFPNMSSLTENNPRFGRMVECKQPLERILQQYTIIYTSLSNRLRSTNIDDAGRQYTIAQAFFTKGCNLIRAAVDCQAGEPLNDSNDMQVSQDGDELLVADQPSQVAARAKSMLGGGGRSPNTPQQGTKLTPLMTISTFQAYVHDILLGVVYTLWPDSDLLVLPRFFVQCAFFESLKNYCNLVSKTLQPEQLFIITFLKANAHCGLNEMAESWRLFEEAAQGVRDRDEQLCKFLDTMSSDIRNYSELPNPIANYFIKVLIILKSRAHSDYIIKAALQVIAHAGNRGDSRLGAVFVDVFWFHMEKRDFHRAVRSIVENPDETKRTNCLRIYLQQMISGNCARALVEIDYGHLSTLVADLIDARCFSKANFGGDEVFRIAYAFHSLRFDFVRAARVMYEYSLHLAAAAQTTETLEKRARILSVVYQTLDLIPAECAFIECSVERDIREAQFVQSSAKGAVAVTGSTSTTDVVNLTLADIGREMIKTEARLVLRAANESVVPSLLAADIVRELIYYEKFDMAWLVMSQFELSCYDFITAVTEKAIQTDIERRKRNEADMLDADAPLAELPGWVYCNRKFLKTPEVRECEFHWRIVISYIELALSRSPSDAKILQHVAKAFLSRHVELPTWLISRYKKVHVGDYILTLLDYGELTKAAADIPAIVDAAAKCVRAGQSIADLHALLPYTHITLFFDMAERRGIDASAVEKSMQRFFEAYRVVRKGATMSERVALTTGRDNESLAAAGFSF